MARQQPKVLVVDDDVDICSNMTDILADLGYDVDSAHDGPTALEMVRRTPYDIALLDLKMPGMDGLTLYREMKKLRAGTVAMLVTAYAGGSTAEDALLAGAWKVLPKPVDFPRLLSLIEQAVGQPLVLVVDDDHDLCQNLWDLLRDCDYRVGLAHDASEAASELAEMDFKVVLIDMKIGDDHGGDVFRLVREVRPEAKTVLITGHRSEMDDQVNQILAEGADTVCYKPFDVPRLLSELEQLTRQDAEKGRG